MNNSICTLFDNILIDIHKFKSLLCKPPKRKSKLLKIFLRFPHINRTVSDGETYISALENLRFRNGKRKK